MNLITAVIAALALVLFSGQIQAKAEDPFISTAETRKISTEYNIDVRALHVTIKNDSALSITSGQLVCDKYDRRNAQPRIAATGFPWCTGNELPHQSSGPRRICESTYPYINFFSDTIKSGKTKILYFELHDHEAPVVRCEIKELRGHEAKFWEF